jgi:predicted amidophosphoribosyltransferase
MVTAGAEHGVAADSPPSLSLGPLAVLARLAAERPTVRGRGKRMLCPRCGGEFVEGTETCPDCGVALVHEAPEPVGHGPGEPAASLDAALVTVFRTTDPLEFAVVNSALETAAIPLVAQGERWLAKQPFGCWGAAAVCASLLVPADRRRRRLFGREVPAPSNQSLHRTRGCAARR